jgi:predicted lipid-binding transport protein (Tim44 family)
MNRHRSLAVVAALAAALTVAAAASDAFARAGKNNSSSGSRGTRTEMAPAPTQTAPNTVSPSTAAPSAAAPSAATRPSAAQPAMAPQQSGGFFSRGGFGGMLMGGLIGAGIAGLLFGGGFLDGLGSLAGMLGFLLQVAVIGFLVMLAVRFFRNRSQASRQPEPAYAGVGGDPLRRETAGNGGGLAGGLGGLGGLMGGGAAAARPAPAAPSDEIGVQPADYQAFERLLGEVQDAYARADKPALARLTTPEMAGHFGAELDDLAARGLVNRISGVRLLQGDLSEAWAEGDVEYATVAMRFALVDVTIEKVGGRVVEGDPSQPTEATEIWTFRRDHGGQWVLSAIQHAD